jgi:hypothetical protein
VKPGHGPDAQVTQRNGVRRHVGIVSRK